MNSADNEPTTAAESPSGALQEQPFVAKLVADGTPSPPPAEQTNVAGVRVGSPFRKDPADLGPESPAVTTPQPIEAAYADYGPFLYTAMGASVAAVIVLIFDAAGSLWFPAGGAVVAVLGTVLSIIGLFSLKRFRWAALAAFPAHIALFFFSYARSLM